MLSYQTGELELTHLARYRTLVAQFMRTTAPATSSLMGRMAAYHMGWVDRDGRPSDSLPGKFLRSSLCLWANEAYGGDVDVALPVAAALEWIHNFTLIHDDIQDGDRERRGRATVWSIWGAAQGINAGDALHALALRALGQDGCRPEGRLHAVRVIADAVLQMIEGQCLDLELERRPDFSKRSYLRLALAKTGALFGASLEAGALLAGAPARILRRLRRAGRLLGVAFQMRDDWLGTWGDPATTGKPADGDLERRKATYVLVSAYATMTEAQRSRLHGLIETVVRRPVREIRALLEEVGGAELTRHASQRCADKAAAIVAGTGLDEEHVDHFREVARYVAQRSR